MTNLSIADDKTPAGQRKKFIVRGSELEYSREGNVLRNT